MASMFQGLLKTPEQVRQEEQKMLQDRGLTAAAMLTRGSGGASSALPGLLQGFAGNIAQNIDSNAQNLVQRGLGGLGGISGALGRQDMQAALQQAGMSAEQVQAMKGQGIAKGIKSDDPESLRNAAQQFRQAGLPQAAEAAETRAAAIESAQAKAKIEERKLGVSEGQLAVSKEQLDLARKKEARVAKAEEKGYTTLDADAMLTAGFPQSKIDAGMVVSRGPKGKLDVVFDPGTPDALPISNVKTVVNNNTKKATQIGLMGNKLVEITAEGPRPVDFDYTKPVELTGNIADDRIKVTKEARAQLGPIKDYIAATDQALIQAVKARDENNPTAEALLNRSLAGITGDKSLGTKEIEMLANTGSIPSKVANTLSKMVTGTSTGVKINEKIEAIQALRNYYASDLDARLKSFDANFGELGVDIDQYRLKGSKQSAQGFSSEASALMKELGINPGE